MDTKTAASRVESGSSRIRGPFFGPRCRGGIEGANKELGTRTLISQATFEGPGGRLATRRIEELAELRGRQTRMVLYELLGPTSP